MSSWVEVTDSGLMPNLAFFRNVKPNDYELKGGMVVYITGEKGAGKTQLMAHLAGTQMLPPIAYDKVCAAREEAAELRAKGYKYQALWSYKLRFVFSDCEHHLAYLNGKAFQVNSVDFVEEYFPGFKIP